MNTPIFEHRAGSSALLISFPHSGTYVPPSLRERFTAQAAQVPDTDWHVPLLYAGCAELGASTLMATHSRYVVDLNRDPQGAALYPGKTETSVCPTQTFAQAPIYANNIPTAAEQAARIEQYWQPYHRKLNELIDLIRTQHGHCIVWDAHSIRSQVPAFFDGRLPDLNVGTHDGASCAINTAQAFMAPIVAQQQFSYVLNGRFKGGYITRHYGCPARGVGALQLEIAQAAYMDESNPTRFVPARAASLQTLLRKLFVAMIQR